MLWTLAYIILMPLFKILYRLRVLGRENIPKRGAVIVAANHKSYLDPIVLGLACPRKIFFMAKEELFRIPLFKHLIKWLYAFPIRREKGDRQALKAALKLLSQGKVVGVFPEGTRYRQGKLGPMQTGTSLLAFKSGAPIVPLAIAGTNKVLPKGKILPRFPIITARVGRPILVNKRKAVSKKELLELAGEIGKALKALLQKEEGD